MADLAVLLAGWGTDPVQLGPIRTALAEQASDAEVWSYDTSHRLELLSARLAGRLTDRSASQGLGLHLVGHSLGGLLAAGAALRARGVRSVTTINAPWRGTWVGYTGGSPLARDLRWCSPPLRRLRSRLSDHLEESQGPDWLVLSCIGDLAAPATTALRTGARGDRLQRRLMALAGHSRSLASPSLTAAVADHVRRTGGHAQDSHPDGGTLSVSADLPG